MKKIKEKIEVQQLDIDVEMKQRKINIGKKRDKYSEYVRANNTEYIIGVY